MICEFWDQNKMCACFRIPEDKTTGSASGEVGMNPLIPSEFPDYPLHDFAASLTDGDEQRTAGLNVVEGTADPDPDEGSVIMSELVQ